MSAPRVLLSLRGCRTRAEALARYTAWLDTHLDDLVKQIAWTLEQEDADDAAADWLAEIEAARYAMAQQRETAIASFLQALDAARADREAER